MDFFTQFDMDILNYIHENWTSKFLDTVIPWISFLGEAGWLWIAVAVIMMIFPRTRKTGVMLSVSLVLGLIFCNGLLKNIVARPRPYTLDVALVKVGDLIIGEPSDFSWPSGHTTASFEAAGVLMIRDKRFGIPALIVAVMIAFSRMYEYVHFPTDIIGGILLGLANAVIAFLIVNFAWKKFEELSEMKKKANLK